MKIKNFFKAIAYQFKKKGWFKNWFITRNAWGLFSKHSHTNKNGKDKISYPRYDSAIRAAEKNGEEAQLSFFCV